MAILIFIVKRVVYISLDLKKSYGAMSSLSGTFEAIAESKLPQEVYEYIAGGAGSGQTVKNNIMAFEHYSMRPQRKIAPNNSVGLEALVRSIAIAPMAFHRICGGEHSEITTAKAASKIGVPMVVPLMSTATLEEVAESSTTDLYFQMHLFSDLEVNINLAQRAERSGYKAIVLSIDVPSLKSLVENHGNVFKPPFQSANLQPYASFELFRPHGTWAELSSLIMSINLPVYLKGLMELEDLAVAKQTAAKGVIVSNHGGRRIDHVRASLDVLSDIIENAEHLEVWVDGGVRSGRDIFMALALGAEKVLLGRPIFWALAAAGQLGIEKLLANFISEFKSYHTKMRGAWGAGCLFKKICQEKSGQYSNYTSFLNG